MTVYNLWKEKEREARVECKAGDVCVCVVTISSSLGLVSWILSNVVSLAFTRVVLMVTPDRRWTYIQITLVKILGEVYRSYPTVSPHVWSFPTV